MPRFDADRLDRAMFERGLDGDRLAELTGLHRSVISRARQGKPVRLKTMKTIAAALERKPVDQIAKELLA